MAEDLRINIIADASQAERALKSVEAEAARVTNTLKGVSGAMNDVAAASARGTNAAIGDMRRLGNEAERAAAKVAALNRAYTSGVNARQIGRANPSPFPAATGGGFDGRSLGPISVSGGVAGGAIAGAIYGQISAANSYNDSVQSYYSPQAIGLGNQGPLAAAKTLGVDATRAYNDYAASLGKTADALTIAEQKQAVFNAAVGKGAQILAESNAYRNSAAGRYQSGKDALGRGTDALGAFSIGTGFTGVLGAFFNPQAVYDAANIARGGDYANPPTLGLDYGAGIAGIRGGAGALGGGLLALLSNATSATYAAQQARLAGFDESARLAGNSGFFGAGDIAAYNRQQYQNAGDRYRAQQAAAASAYYGGVGNLVSLQNRAGDLQSSIEFNPGQDYTGTYVKYGESTAARTARIFDQLSGFTDEKDRRRFLIAATAGLSPADLTDDQRNTLQSAIDQSIKDQITELNAQSKLQAEMAKNLEKIKNKLVGAEDTDPPIEEMTKIVVSDETGPLSSVRFSDDQRNSAFTTNGDSFSNVDGF